MSSGRNKKALGTKRPVPQKSSKQMSLNSADLSSIEKASFLEGLNYNNDNQVLHSTALEEDLTGKSRPAAIKEKPKKKTVERVSKPNAASGRGRKSGQEKSAGKKTAKTPGATSSRESMPPLPRAKVQPKRDKKAELEAGNSSNAEPERDLHSGINEKRRRSQILSDDDGDEGESWQPSPKKTRRILDAKNRDTSKKSSTAGDATKAPKTTSDKKLKKRTSGRSELEVILAAFMEFCTVYSDSVESKAVKEHIDMFSDNVQGQLTEKISSQKEWMTLKRENAKLATMTARKRTRLLEAKNELMNAEAKLWQLNKEKEDLEVRLSDLKQGHGFLSSIKELRQQYQHPKEIVKYGASSLPALLLETKLIQKAEMSLKRVNRRMEKRLKEMKPC